jgi:hypothetical protein
MAKRKATGHFVRVVTTGLFGGGHDIVDPLHFEKGDQSAERLATLLRAIMDECEEAAGGSEPEEPSHNEPALDPLKPETDRRVQHAWAGLDLILYNLQSALKSNDAAAAAFVGLQIGLHTQAGKFAPQLVLAEMAKNRAEAFKRRSVQQGKANRAKVRAARAKIINAEPDITSKKLIGAIKGETGLSRSTIFEHLPAQRKKT